MVTTLQWIIGVLNIVLCQQLRIKNLTNKSQSMEAKDHWTIKQALI